MKNTIKDLNLQLLKNVAQEFSKFDKTLEEEFYRYCIKNFNDKGGSLSLAFMYFCIDFVNKLNPTDELISLPKEFNVLKLWENTNRLYRTLIPQEGDIVVWGHYDKKVNKIVSGTVGIIIAKRSHLDCTIAEGFVNSIFENYKESKQGIYLHNYSLRGNQRKRILGFFHPWIESDKIKKN